MKKLRFIILLVVVIGLMNCGKGKEEGTPPAAETKTAVVTETAKEVKHYTIEQFMNTVSMFRSSFSHDESKVLFTGNKSGIYNAYSIPVGGGEAEQLTVSEKESVITLSYFPKDNRILFTGDKGGNELNHIFVRNEDGSEKDLTPEPKAKAMFFGWSYDQKSFFFQSNKRDPKFMDLYEMDIATFTPKLIFKNTEGYDPAEISNNKKHLALRKTDTDHNSDIYLYDIEKKEMKHLTPHEGDVNNSPSAFGPASKKLFYLTDENSEFNYLKSYDIAGGKSEKILEKKWDIRYAYFSKHGKYRVASINNDGRTEIEIYDMAAQKNLTLPEFPDASISSIKISDSEKLMTFYANGSKSPSSLFIYNIETGKYKQLTDSMNPEIDKAHLAKAEVIRYKSFDGIDIPAIFYKPAVIPAGVKIPALVWVHGGPGGQSRVGYRGVIQYLVNHGYAILAVNNRGSSGYGKTFYGLDDLKHGQDDLQDCVEAKKFLKARDYIDGDKIGIIGGSYGGYMVLAALAFTPEEFTVGVDIFGVSNWLRTLKSIPPYWESFRKALYKELGNPETDEEFLKKKSPLFHADKITKPLIVLQGANDPRVLKVESDEIVAAVKKNNVPVEYVVFEDEGHGFRKKKNEIEAYKAILKFLDKYLKQKKETYIY
ncbi:MAG: S9 family peptidase [Candidatus Aminicenantes bacterium]|nr:S9 family peptidase [Candidatus Aminicenantes bacterium]